MLTRIITGVIGIVAAVGIITKGGMLFNAAVAVLAAVAWYEYHKMVENKGYHAYTLTGGVGALLMVLVAGAGYYFELEGVYTLAFIVMLTALFFIFSTIEGLWLHCNRGEQHWAENSALTAWGMTVLRSFVCAHYFVTLPLMVVRISIWASAYLSTAKYCLWIVLLGTWASDTFAYFFGRAFGKTPFCSVSPKNPLRRGLRLCRLLCDRTVSVHYLPGYCFVACCGSGAGGGNFCSGRRFDRIHCQTQL